MSINMSRTPFEKYKQPMSKKLYVWKPLTVNKARPQQGAGNRRSFGRSFGRGSGLGNWR